MAGNSSATIRIVSNRLPQIAAAIRPAVSAEVKRATLDIQAKAQAMAPVKTGTLRRSITSQFPTDLSGVVGPSVNYGAYVEFGTRRMGARPYMRPAAEAVLAGFSGRVGAVIRTVAMGGSAPAASAAPAGSESVAAPSAPVKEPKKYVPKLSKPMGYIPKAPKARAGESSGFREAQRRYTAYQRSSNRRQHGRRKST